MTYSELNKHIQKGILAPIYLFYGEEEYLIQEGIKKVIEKAIDESIREFNFDRINAEGGKAGEVIAKASLVPFMSKKRVVVVNNGDKFNKKDIDLLIKYFYAPIDSTCLVIHSSNLDPYTEFYKTAKVKGIIINFYPLKGEQLISWCRRKVEEYNCQINKEAVSYLKDIVGNNLWQLDNEIKKLSIYVGKGERITIKTIDEVVSKVSTHSIFELTDALGSKNFRHGLVLLHRMLQTGQQPLMVMAMIIRQFRLIWQGKCLKKHLIKPEAIANKLKIHRMFLNRFLRQLDLFTFSELRKLFYQFYEVDLKLKSGQLNPESLLELLVFRICGTDEVAP